MNSMNRQPEWFGRKEKKMISGELCIVIRLDEQGRREVEQAYRTLDKIYKEISCITSGCDSMEKLSDAKYILSLI